MDLSTLLLLVPHEANEAQEAATIKPLGWLLIIGFIIILAICIYVDKTSNKRFRAKIEKEYPSVDSLGAMFVTEKKELLLYLGSGTLIGWKKWNLNDIAYVSINDRGFSLKDSNKKSLKGDYLTASKKPLKEKAFAFFPVGEDDARAYAEFITKHNPSIEVINE